MRSAPSVALLGLLATTNLLPACDKKNDSDQRLVDAGVVEVQTSPPCLEKFYGTKALNAAQQEVKKTVSELLTDGFYKISCRDTEAFQNGDLKEHLMDKDDLVCLEHIQNTKEQKQDEIDIWLRGSEDPERSISAGYFHYAKWKNGSSSGGNSFFGGLGLDEDITCDVHFDKPGCASNHLVVSNFQDFLECQCQLPKSKRLDIDCGRVQEYKDHPELLKK